MTSGSEGISGEVQMTLIFSKSVGCTIFRRSMLSVLFVATSTWPLATAMALDSWLALRVTLKNVLGSTLCLANT
ncbi:hypothetical protein GALL_419500 [mine drainage metagenome]|uniref:Uncharacterized protein n=1 Tax=mine drainage metagenome TaxID=410659 RepID=A0A1J5QK46_9ZZZZ